MGLTSSTVLISLILPLSYVSLVQLADWNGNNRNDAKSIKRRFMGAGISNILSILIVYYNLKDVSESPFREMGIRLDSLPQALGFSLSLVLSLYFGQFVMMHLDNTLQYIFDYNDWKRSFKSLQWIRNIIVGPVTEEICFRCCSATLMNRTLSVLSTALLAPLPFAASHFHHIIDDQRRGYSLAHSLLQRTFQFVYTYVFGIFATYMQLTTRHWVVPIVAHIVCNSQGLPLLLEIEKYTRKRDRNLLYASYSFGFFLMTYQIYSQYGMPKP